MTGYPSIDKPQEQFYRKTPIREVNVNQTIYELIFNTNKDNMDQPAIEYMGINWSFKKLKEQTDKAADAFLKSGLKMGDTVLFGVSNCPEAVVSLFALNKIGVISKWFDIRADEKDIESYINSSACKYLIAFDMLLPKIEQVINNTNLEKVLVIHPTDSLSIIPQAFYSFKANKMPNDSRYVRFKEFIKSGQINNNTPVVPFDKNRPSIMIQSSGTTGKPKTIVHSDYSATVCAHKLSYADWPVEFGKELLVLLPPWIAYAIGNAIIYPLAMGTKLILCPSFEPEVLIKNLGKFTICMTAPICYRYLKENFDSLSKKQLQGLEKIECLVSGGDKITTEENISIEKTLNTTLVNGWGDNEGWGCLAVNPVKNNKYGTVGIAKYGETIIAYDNDTEKELPFGESGEICALTETLFIGYENNHEETAAVKKLHPDGKVWLHTGDLGFIDKDGYITLQGRLRRVIVRMAFKISAYTIEDKITEHPAVKECVAVEVKDNVEEHVPMAYIVLNDNIDDVEKAKQSIYEKCLAELKEHEIPKYFRIVSSLPYTLNNKYDFRLLEQQGNEYVNSLNN